MAGKATVRVLGERASSSGPKNGRRTDGAGSAVDCDGVPTRFTKKHPLPPPCILRAAEQGQNIDQAWQAHDNKRCSCPPEDKPEALD